MQGKLFLLMKKNVARIAKAALHKLSGKSSFNAISVCNVRVVCPSLKEGRLYLIRLDPTASSIELGMGLR